MWNLITKGLGAKETDREDHLFNSTVSVSTDNSTDYSFPLMTNIVKSLYASLKQYFQINYSLKIFLYFISYVFPFHLNVVTRKQS